MKKILVISYDELDITKGGVHRVSKFLVDGLNKYGYSAEYIIFKENDFCFYRNNSEVERNLFSVEAFKQYLIDEHVEVIIYQDGIFANSFPSLITSFGLPNVRLFTVFHNTPAIYDRLYNFRWLLSKCRNANNFIKALPYIIKVVLFPIWKILSRRGLIKRYRSVYDNSDICVLLSEKEFNTLQRYVPTLSKNKCKAIPNALTFAVTSETSILTTKQKFVLIVSRLNDDEKRISLALKIWNKIEASNITDWHLVIVGTGPHESNLRRLANELHLKNVKFEGRQQSEPYYSNASIFMMTSAVEGWGLTLTESMQRGVVPIAFDSYPALNDILIDNFNGCIIKNNDIDSYFEKLIFLMKHKDAREAIAKNALDSCKRYDPEIVIKQWINLIEN